MKMSVTLLAVFLVFSPQASASDDQSAQLLSTFKDCDRCPEMVVLPAGRYLMGASQEDRRIADRYSIASELPQHPVTINYSFAIGKYEVTVEEFAAYIDETGAKTGGDCELRLPDSGPNRDRFLGTLKPGAERVPGVATISDGDFRKPGAIVTGKHPATCISHREAEAYLSWLSQRSGKAYRVPTEAEWEYAARAGTTTPFYFGSNRASLCGYGNFADKASPYHARMVAQCAEKPSPEMTAPVGSYKPNAWGYMIWPAMRSSSRKTVRPTTTIKRRQTVPLTVQIVVRPL
jgi:formylglycine-generating enzyme required for sulfatase activity